MIRLFLRRVFASYPLLFGAAVGTLWVVPAHAQTYVASFLAVPAGTTGGVATSISDGQIGGYSYTNVLNMQGQLWNVSTPSTVTNLGTSTQVWGVSGGKQVGNSVSTRAIYWSGTAASRQNFNDQFVQNGTTFFPRNASAAYGISGTKSVGFIYGVDQNGEVHNHAMLWSTLTSTAIDLHPSGTYDSEALGVSATQQVGYAGFASSGHAYLWTGNAASGVDLHPSGFMYSVARATAGGVQSGSVTNDLSSNVFGTSTTQAALWTGSAASFVNLNPLGYATSSIYGAADGVQVGSAALANGVMNAFFWSGTPASAVNLQQFLPAGTGSSVAYGVDSSGNIVGAADGRPVLWKRVSAAAAPEPNVLLLLASGAGWAGLAFFPRRHSGKKHAPTTL